MTASGSPSAVATGALPTESAKGGAEMLSTDAL